MAKYYGRFAGRRRVFDLQEYKGREYLVGAMYHGKKKILRFEATRREVETASETGIYEVKGAEKFLRKKTDSQGQATQTDTPESGIRADPRNR
jgi:hypothetical protein